MNETQIENTLNEFSLKLRYLREKDEGRRIYGANFHRYQLNRILSETELTDFEAHHHIELPTEYRAFLKILGNGGAGPGLGLISLEQALPEDSDLSTPFPFTKRSRTYRKGISGYLTMSNQGCGFFDVLIVSGSEYGNMWFDGRGGEATATWYPYRLSFFSWYHKWLSEALAEIERTRTG